jgi:hypothetical protein
MMTFRGFLGRPCPNEPDGPDVTAGKGAVEESDAYQGPDDLLLPSESFATPSTVLTAQIRGKYICAWRRPQRLVGVGDHGQVMSLMRRVGTSVPQATIRPEDEAR